MKPVYTPVDTVRLTTEGMNNNNHGNSTSSSINTNPIGVNGTKIDLKSLSQKLANIQLNTADHGNSPNIIDDGLGKSPVHVDTHPEPHDHLKEMISSLHRHSECLINTQEWPNWEDDLKSFQQTSQQFRPLKAFPFHGFPQISKYRIIREGLSAKLNDHDDEGRFERIKELRLAVIGNVDAGKSTLLGVLSRGGLDDGRGRARIVCARHRHENETGRTSSVSQELLGVRMDGSHIADDRVVGAPVFDTRDLLRHQKAAWEAAVGKDAWKVISLIDLAGHEKYLKTTMFGLTGFCPDLALLMVGANTGGLIGTSREHLALANALAIPVIVCVTKVDLAPEAVHQATLQHIHKILKSPTCRKTPLVIRSIDDVAYVIKSGSLAANQLCPIFEISNVTGQGIDLLRELLNMAPIPDAIRERWWTARSAPTEYLINETYTVPGVGTVVSGVVVSGSIKLGDQLLLGPADSNARFIPTVVRGIQRKRVNLAQATAGQGVSLALKRVKRSDIRYGMALVSSTNGAGASGASLATINGNTPQGPLVSREFTAHVIILYHSTTITSKYQAMLHCGTIRQTVQIVSLDVIDTAGNGNGSDQRSESSAGAIGRTGDRAKIRFRFIKHPEILHVGMKILFREGRTRGIGKVIELH